LGLGTLIGLLDDYAAMFFQMPWTMLESQRPDFVTSDSGLGVIDPGRDSYEQVSVLGSRSARLLLPISRSDCWQIGPVGPWSASIERASPDGKEIMKVNLALYG
jgi:hypothetical protein